MMDTLSSETKTRRLPGRSPQAAAASGERGDGHTASMGWCYACQSWRSDGFPGVVRRPACRSGNWWHEWRCAECEDEHGWDAVDHPAAVSP